jgi:uncharacterized damage-inducible protein DinB
MATSDQTLNPYASHLGQQDPLEVLEATPTKLNALITAISPPVLLQDRAPGKWSVRHILCHLADTESVFSFRLRQTIAEEHHVIQPYDQEKFVIAYDAVSPQEALAAFTAFRNWNLALIKAVGPETMSKKLTHPERGTMTFATIVETMAGHDLNHLSQIQACKDS